MILGAVSSVVAAAVAVSSVLAPTPAKVSEAKTAASSNAVFGVTHTQFDADPWYPSDSVQRARYVLKAVAPVQNQSIMGWGALNPEPSPGQYSWSSLDNRMALIRATDATPVVTLCCSPDWMTGGASGTTDWSKLGTAPTPAHFEDFAKLAVQVARRYPYVHYFQVWNELKGFYDPATNNWRIAAYTRMYNDVYRALKRYNPEINVGGPYVPMDSWAAPSAVSVAM